VKETSTDEEYTFWWVYEQLELILSWQLTKHELKLFRQVQHLRLQQNQEVSLLQNSKLRNFYDPIYIHDLREVRGGGNSSSVDLGDISGTMTLVGLFAGAWAFIAFTPWILMIIGGATGTWIGQKIAGKTIDEVNEGPSNSKAGAIILVLMMLGGGFGFVKGDEIKKGFDAPSDTPTEVRKANRSL